MAKQTALSVSELAARLDANETNFNTKFDQLAGLMSRMLNERKSETARPEPIRTIERVAAPVEAGDTYPKLDTGKELDWPAVEASVSEDHWKELRSFGAERDDNNKAIKELVPREWDGVTSMKERYKQDPNCQFGPSGRQFANWMVRYLQGKEGDSLTKARQKKAVAMVALAIEDGWKIGNLVPEAATTASTGNRRGKGGTVHQRPVTQSFQNMTPAQLRAMADELESEPEPVQAPEIPAMTDAQYRTVAANLNLKGIPVRGSLGTAAKTRILDAFKANQAKKTTAVTSTAVNGTVKLDADEKAIVRKQLNASTAHTSGAMQKIAQKLGVPDISNRGILTAEKLAAIAKAGGVRK